MPVLAVIDASGLVLNLIVAELGTLEPAEGQTLVETGGLPVAIGWTHSVQGFVEQPQSEQPPQAPSARIISSDEFRQLFTPAQQAALWSADPALLAGMLKVITQGSANLDSDEASNLLALGVAKGALSESEKERILAGRQPATDASTP